MVDTFLLEAGIAYTIWESSSYCASDEVLGFLASAHRVNAPYQALRTKDSYINIGAATQSTWEQLCRAPGLASLIYEERFVAPSDGKIREKLLADLLKETFSKQTTDYWMRLLDEAGVVAGPIYDVAQVYRSPHVKARNMLVDLKDPELGLLHNIGIPIKLWVTPGQIRWRAPDSGEHTREILREYGLSTEEMAALIDDSVVNA